MSFRSKIYPSLSNKAFAFLDSPLELKLTLKTTEETSFPKHQTKSSRSTSPQTIFIPKSSNFSSSQDKIHSARAHSQDKEFNSTKRPTLPILQTIKAYKENNKQKLTSKNLKNKGENSDSNQTSIKRINRSAEKKHSKGFRIRTSTSSNNIVSLDILKSSKTKSFQKNKVKKPGSMPTVGDEPDLFTSRTCNLNRMCFNIPSQARTNLPLLIVHFEGIIGSCLIHNKENISKDSNLLEEYFFVKKDVKEEMKQLSKKFVIAIVFPTLNNKYKVAMKHLINRKFPFDGAYYKTQTSETSNPYSINKYILDYKTVINDFRAHKTNRKVILLLPLGLSTSLIQKHLLQKEPETNFPRRFSLDKSCFIHFFPKMEAVNRKFLCVPNFLLEEKNEQYAALYKSEFCSLTRLLIRTLESGFPKNEQLIKSKTRDFDPIMVTNDESSCHEIENVPDLVEQKELKNVTEEKSESYDKNQLKELNFEGLLYEMERMTKINDKLKGLGSIKDNFGVQKENLSFIFDQSAMRQKMVENLAYIQREKITAGGINPKENGVLITGVVGDLFTSNANIIKIYEKDSFYANKNQLKKITAITEYLDEKNNDNTLEERKNEDEIIIRTGGMKEKSRIFKFFNPKKDENNSSLDFSSDKSKLKFACEDNYSLELLLIKEIASEIYLYTQEEINNFES